MKRIVFMGTPDFAVQVLEKLSQNKDWEIVAVVTQPDRPRGRGQRLSFSPVKEKALELGLNVLQPERVREEVFIRQLIKLRPDLIVVAAFGQILPEAVLSIPPHGCLNVHASLLPAYRGAAPIQRVIMEGGEKTGVSIMLMDKGLDTGDVLAQAEIPLSPGMNCGDLHDCLAQMGAELLQETIPRWLRGEIKPLAQERITERAPSYAAPLKKEDERICWANSARMIYNQIRALTPWPGAHTIYEGKPLKIWEAVPYQPASSEEAAASTAALASATTVSTKTKTASTLATTASTATAKGSSGAAPGTVVAIVKGQGFVVQTGEGKLLVKQVQPVGKKPISAQSFLNGYRLEVGYVFANI